MLQGSLDDGLELRHSTEYRGSGRHHAHPARVATSTRYFQMMY